MIDKYIYYAIIYSKIQILGIRLHDKNSITIPGYSLLGRMKGLDQLKGIIKTII